VSSTPRAVIGASIRHKVEPRDWRPEKVARRLGLTLTDFILLRDDLFVRGVPRPDSTTGNYDSVAIERWQDARFGLSASPSAEVRMPRDPAQGLALS
jgi:hypothetical protein